MKRLLLIFVLLIGSSAMLHSQCMPDPLYADSVFGVWPDTATNFPPAILNTEYFAQVDVIVPENTSDVPGLDLPFDLPIDSGAILDIQGLPPGMSFECNSHTPSSCTFLPGIQGCGTVFGSPTDTGTYVLNVQLRAYLNFFGVVTEDVDFDGYRIIVSESAVTVAENSALQAVGQNSPNPFTLTTRIDYRLSEPSEVTFAVLDMLGKEVYSEQRNGFSGRNSFAYTPEDLKAGVYLYSITSSEGRVTKRMVYRPQ